MMTMQDEYLEQDHLVEVNTAVIRSFLQKFTKGYSTIGDNFYSDVTISAGPLRDKFWNTREGQEINERWQNMDNLSVLSIRKLDAAFIIARGQNKNVTLPMADRNAPTKAQFIYNGKKFPVPMNVAIAASNLFIAQEHRSTIYGIMLQKDRLGY